MTLKDKLVSDILVSTLIKIAQKGRGIFFIPVITFYLGTSAYGAYTQLLVVANLFAGIFGFGLHAGLVRYLQSCDGKKEQRELYFDIAFFAAGVGLVVSSIIYTLSHQLSVLTLGESTYTSVYQIGSILILTEILNSICHNYYKSSRLLKLYSVIDGVKTYTTIAIVSYVVIIKSGTLIEVVSVLVIIETSFFLILQGDVIRRLGVSRPKFQTLPKILNYSILFMVSQVSSGFLSRADRLLLGYFIGPAAVGIYTAAYKVSNLILLFALPLNNSFFPEFSKLWEEGKRQEAMQYLNAGVRYFLILSLPSIVGFLLVGESVLGFLVPESTASKAVTLLPGLGMGIALWSLIRLYSSLFFAAESPKRVAIVRASGGIINVILNLVLIPYFGLFGAVFTTIVSYLVVFTILLLWAKSELGMQSHLPGLAKTAISSVAMYIVIQQIRIESLLLTILTAVLIYFGILYGIGGVSKDDIKSVMNPLKSFLQLTS